MGEVYRARDTRLDRDVAVKVLPDSVASREDVRARFEREARAISALNHPHICTLFDVGREGSVEYLVMELLEGETLASILSRGQLPADRALRYAREIAIALDAAHKHGIVHRDLKPGNVMITKSGVKLLDFGLARAAMPRAAANDAPTVVNPITEEGVVLGTLEYMSPEQLQGHATDARTDIFSFGCMVYEMFTGKRAFSGGSPASVITAIMSSEPPKMSALAPVTPVALERLVSKCLEKNPDDRWQSAGDLAIELEWIAAGRNDVASGAPVRASRMPWVITAAALLALAAVLAFALRRPKVPTDVVRATLPLGVDALEYNLLEHELAISPDGRWIVYDGVHHGEGSLCIRSLAEGSVNLLPHTTDAKNPFWSPDSREIAFFAHGKLLRVSRNGGDPTPICDVEPGVTISGAWGVDGTIVFAPLARRGLLRVPASGGKPVTLTAPPSSGTAIHPQFIDSTTLLYVSVAHGADMQLHVVDLKKGSDTSAGPIDSRVEVVGDTALFVRAGTLLAQKFDSHFKLTGEPLQLASGIKGYSTLGNAVFSASEGTIVYVSNATDSQVTLYDRHGNRAGTTGPIGAWHGARRSADGRKLIVSAIASDAGAPDLWLIDAARNTSMRLLSTPLGEVFPIFTPDGRSVIYSYELDGPPHIYTMPAGGGDATMLTPMSGVIEYVCDVTPDGKTLLFSRSDNQSKRDLWMRSADGTLRPWLKTANWEGAARISPDAQFVSYTSDASGANEAYVARFNDPLDRVQVSAGGNVEASAWRGDGRELFYMTSNGDLYSVPITAGTLDGGKPQLLFHVDGADVESFDVSADGNTFYISRSTYGPHNQPLNLILNWKSLLATR